MSTLTDTPAKGGCTDCGRPIGAARLAAKPDAIRCIGCQAIIENARGKRL